eukprot:3324099-Prorocentrum_lima.AAC.1
MQQPAPTLPPIGPPVERRIQMAADRLLRELHRLAAGIPAHYTWSEVCVPLFWLLSEGQTATALSPVRQQWPALVRAVEGLQ